MSRLFKLFAAHAISVSAAVFCFAPLAGEIFAAPILAAATRASAFASTSTASVPVPIRDDGTTSLKFATAAPNESVVVIYNAECALAAARGTRLSIKIVVDGNEAEPSSGTDFTFCSALDSSGNTWASPVRQSVLKVPLSGTHTVRVVARLVGGSGEWRLDDSSLVVQPALGTFATREDAYKSTDTNWNQLPIFQDGGEILDFSTSAANERVKITYNAECVLAAGEPGQYVDSWISIYSAGASAGDLCNAVDSTGQTWAGAARQFAVTIPAAGSYTAVVAGRLSSSPGTWRIDDSSLVITKHVLASTVNDTVFLSSSTTEVAVPIISGGGTALQFSTAKSNQQVKLSYNALCAIMGERGRWLGLRLVVDGVEAAPASGFDFALCSSVAPLNYYYFTGFRQSVITVPNAGIHNAQVFARASGMANWYLGQQSLIVE